MRIRRTYELELSQLSSHKMSYWLKSVWRFGKSVKLRRELHNVRRYFASSAAQQAQDDPTLWVQSPYPHVRIPEGVTPAEFLRSNVKGWGNEIAYECGINGRKYTHNEVYSMSRSFAAALIQSKKFQHGDVIGIVAQNIPEYCPIILGIIEAGLVASPVNPAFTREEIARQFGKSAAKAVVTTPECVQALRTIRNSKECPALDTIIVTGETPDGCHSFFEMTKVDPSGVEFPFGSHYNSKHQTAILLYSSGTTGVPKGVELTHYNMLAHLIQVGSPEVTNVQSYQTGRQERLMAVLPMFHVVGIGWFVNQSLFKGLHTLVLPKFQPESFVKALRSHKPTVLNLVPPLMNFIVTSPEIGPNDLKDVTTTGAGAAPISEQLTHKFLEKLPRDMIFHNGYGMTETFAGITYNKIGLGSDRNKFASCGRPNPNTIIKFVDEDTGSTVGRNVQGELWIKGPQVMKGYHKNEKATRECLDENGWLRTGDIGYYDNDGELFIVDRMKELIKVKGFQVSPSELEGLLSEHPCIVDAAVFGIPDDKAGELPRASIVRKTKSLSEEDVNRFLKDRVAHFKQLRGGIDFVDTIPKAPSGKILRRELLRMYKEQERSGLGD